MRVALDLQRESVNIAFGEKGKRSSCTAPLEDGTSLMVF
jgi:hypothetical protein